MKIEIGKIKITKRIRELGLITPIAVMRLDGGEFHLLAGLRRIRAMEFNGETEIGAKVFPVSDAEEALRIEYSDTRIKGLEAKYEQGKHTD